MRVYGERGGYAREAVGASPVDLHREADHWSDVFQPLDGKPQTDSQLGSSAAKRRRDEAHEHVTGQRRERKHL